MPSPSVESVDIPVQTFGGRVTQFDPQTQPRGCSPLNQDIIYSGITPTGAGIVGGWCTRPGMQQFYANPFAGNPTVNYLATFVDSTGVFHLLSLDGLGNMRDESPCPGVPGVPTIIGSVVAASYAQSDALNSREWIAIGDGQFGIDIPRQWDGQYFDRVSQVGPGIAPTVTDIAYAITAISRTSNTISVTTSAPHELTVGSLVNLVNVSDSTFNGIWPVASVPTATTFTAWGAPGQFAISLMVRAGNVVTATFPTPPFLSVGSHVIVANSPDPSFNGIFTITTISGNNVMWAQVAANSKVTGGVLYTQSIMVSLVNAFGDPLSSSGQVYNVSVQLQPNQSNPFIAGGLMVIAGTSDGTFDGSWTVAGFPQPSQYQIDNNQVQVTITTTVPSGSSTYGGTATVAVPNSSPTVSGLAGPAGSIAAGLHQVAISFLTREQYITKPSPFGFWYASGGFKAQVSAMPQPWITPNVVGVILMFTPVILPPATGGSFYYFESAVPTPSAGTYPAMQINSIVTTTYTVDFSDTALALGTASTYLYNLLELGECSCIHAYSDRTFWAGERNKIPNFLNLTFDGGVVQSSGASPTGWTNGGGSGASLTDSPIWGAAFTMVGTGAAEIGLLTQPAYQDFLGVPIIQAATPYSVRVRAQAYGIPTQGVFNIELYSPTMGSFGIYQVTFAQVTATMQEFIGPLATIASPPTDLLLRIYTNGTPTNGAGFTVDNIEVFPTQQPMNRTLVRGSYADDPESFDQTTGYMIVGQNNGQAVRSLFTLLDSKLYIVKERSLYSTQDDGQNEPNDWAINTVSDVVGTPSINGVDIGESWAIIAAKEGVYIFWGGEPVKISQEIQPDWDMINWSAATTIYVVVDTQNKRIHVGVPTNGSSVPNVEFVCDYSQLANSEGATSGQDIASHPQAYYSQFQPDKIIAPGKARKWTLWNISANCAALTIRSTGTYDLLRGNATSNGKVYNQVTGQLSDDGEPISWQYMTYYFPQAEEEQGLQLGSHRKLFKYLTGYMYGAGPVAFTVYGAQSGFPKDLTSLYLTNSEQWDFEINANYPAERMALLVSGSAVGGWAAMNKFIQVVQRDVMTPVRGKS